MEDHCKDSGFYSEWGGKTLEKNDGLYVLIALLVLVLGVHCVGHKWKQERSDRGIMEGQTGCSKFMKTPFSSSPACRSLSLVTSRKGDILLSCLVPRLSSSAFLVFFVNSHSSDMTCEIITDVCLSFFLSLFLLYFLWKSLGAHSFGKSQRLAQCLGPGRRVWRAGHTLQSYLMERWPHTFAISQHDREEPMQVSPCILGYLHNLYVL